MLLNRLPKLNWSLALGEMLLIFAGITLAFVFDQWKEDKAALIKEHAILEEIAEDLTATKADLDGDIQITQNTLKLQLEYIKAIELGKIPGELAPKVIQLSYGGILFPKISGYKALENAGLDLLRDSNIRSALTDYYELRLTRVRFFENISEEIDLELLAVLEPYMQVIWDTSDNSDETTVTLINNNPEKMTQLVSDTKLMIRLRNARDMKFRILRLYENTDKEIDDLLQNIKAYLENTA